MKRFTNLVIVILAIVFFASCRPTPNHLHNPVNSTESGSGVYEGNNNNSDTLAPANNGIDTSGEQTGRMNNTHQ